MSEIQSSLMAECLRVITTHQERGCAEVEEKFVAILSSKGYNFKHRDELIDFLRTNVERVIHQDDVRPRRGIGMANVWRNDLIESIRIKSEPEPFLWMVTKMMSRKSDGDISLSHTIELIYEFYTQNPYDNDRSRTSTS